MRTSWVLGVGAIVVAIVSGATLRMPVASAGAAPVSTSRSSTGPVAALPACTLLAPSDLHAVFGGTVGEGDPTTAPDGTETICNWVISTNATHGFGVQLDVRKTVSAAEFKQQRKIATGKTTTVPNLGNAAFSERAVVDGHVFDDLWVREAPIAFRVEVLKDVGTKPLRRLANVVLIRLLSRA